MNTAVSIFLFSVLIIQAQSQLYQPSVDSEEDDPKKADSESTVVLNDVMSVILSAYGQHFNKGMHCKGKVENGQKLNKK